jgi:DNA invertase Pin-like site-specific DNA recombinase
MRIALYSRVSTTDKGQTVENQFLAMRADCAARQEPVVLEEQDYLSGTKRFRPGLERIFAAAQRHEFDVLVVWSLDRLTREGAFRALEIIQNLGALGIGFRSLTEIHFDTCGPFKDAIIAIAATLAKLEREKIVERIKAGLDRTRAAGTVLGRTPIVPEITAKVLELSFRGWDAQRIAAGIEYRTKAGRARNPSIATIRQILRSRSLKNKVSCF